MKDHDVIRVVKLRNDRFAARPVEYLRHPRVGDTGAIMQIYSDAFLIECCDRTGTTIWLTEMFHDEVEAT